MAQIDWNEFVIVETIDLFDNEELPAPSTFNKPEVKSIGPEVETGRHFPCIFPLFYLAKPTIPSQYLPQAFPQAQPAPKPTEAAISADANVRKDYVRRTAQTDTATNKCPICGQYIPISEFNEHLRIEMLDPNYREVKQDAQARAQNVTMVSGEDIANNLRAFASNMPTVFGSEEEQRRGERGEILFFF